MAGRRGWGMETRAGGWERGRAWAPGAAAGSKEGDEVALQQPGCLVPAKLLLLLLVLLAWHTQPLLRSSSSSLACTVAPSSPSASPNWSQGSWG